MAEHASDDINFVKSRIEILDCIHRIARGVDRLDRELVLSGYHPDAMDDHATFVGSPEEFVAYFFDVHARAHKSTAHFIGNHICEIDGDIAHAETYYIFSSENLDGPPYSMAGGRYVDKFERRNGRWAIAVRKCVLTWDSTPDSPVSRFMTKAFAGVGHNSRDREDLSYDRPLAMTAERLTLRN